MVKRILLILTLGVFIASCDEANDWFHETFVGEPEHVYAGERSECYRWFGGSSLDLFNRITRECEGR